jgi:hypothetical protein
MVTKQIIPLPQMTPIWDQPDCQSRLNGTDADIIASKGAKTTIRLKRYRHEIRVMNAAPATNPTNTTQIPEQTVAEVVEM